MPTLSVKKAWVIAANTTFAAQIQGEIEASRGGSLRPRIFAIDDKFGVVERLSRRSEPGLCGGELRFRGAIAGVLLPSGLQRLTERGRGLGIGRLGGERRCRQQACCQDRARQPRDEAPSRRTNKVHGVIL